MDELDLHHLADEPAPSGLTVAEPRPVEVVLHRSRQIRRRRRGGRVVGLALLLAAAVGARALVPGRDPEPGKVATSVAGLCTREPETSLLAPGSSPAPNVPLDQIDVEGGPAVLPRAVPAGELGDLLMLPSQVPDGTTVALAKGWRAPGDCPDGPLLSLVSDGADGTIDATIKLLGPYRGFKVPSFVGAQSFEPVALRGGQAWVTYVPYPQQPLTVISWTDPDGVSWLLEGQHAGETTLLAVAEALVLDAQASPPATLPDAAVPAGWSVTWQAPDPPTSLPGAGDDVTGWAVDIRGPDDSSADNCSVSVTSTTAADAPVVADASPGDRRTTVHGQDALMLDGISVRWNEPSGAEVSVWCLPGYDGILDLAESLTPAAPDDPRIPPGGG